MGIEDGFSESWLYPADLDFQYPTVRIDTQAGWEVSFQSATPPPYQHSITYTRRAAFRKPPLLSLFESQIPIDSYVIIDIAIMYARDVTAFRVLSRSLVIVGECRCHDSFVEEDLH